MSKGVRLTEEEKQEIIRLRKLGYRINDVASKTKHGTTAVYSVLKNYGLTEEPTDESSCMILPKDIAKFKSSIHIGDKFRVYRETIDMYGIKHNEFVTETVKGIYPYIVDCTYGSYRYVELMNCKKVYDGE